MYTKILVPVDLNHQDEQMKALKTAAMVAIGDGASITLLNVAGFAYQHPARNADDFINDLNDFAYRAGKELGVELSTASRYSHDPAAELDRRIRDEIEAGDYDLLVMASHVPGLIEYVFSSHAGHLAAHAKISVFVVRP